MILSISNVFLGLIFVVLIISLAVIDYFTMRLPDKLVIPLLLLGFFKALISHSNPGIWNSLLTCLGGGIMFGLIAALYPAGMGWGDVKLIAALGAYLGFPNILFALLIAVFSGTILGGILLITKRITIKQCIPFGPYLAFGALITLFWGIIEIT